MQTNRVGTYHSTLTQHDESCTNFYLSHLKINTLQAGEKKLHRETTKNKQTKRVILHTYIMSTMISRKVNDCEHNRHGQIRTHDYDHHKPPSQICRLQGDHSTDNLKFPDGSRHSSTALGMLHVTHIMPVLVLLSVVGVGMQQWMIRNHIFNI